MKSLVVCSGMWKLIGNGSICGENYSPPVDPWVGRAILLHPDGAHSEHDLFEVRLKSDQQAARATPCKLPPRLHTTRLQILKPMRILWRAHRSDSSEF